MNRVSAKNAREIKRLAPIRRQYVDSQGITLDEVGLWLPGRVADWPAVVRVKDVLICANMHLWFPVCWWCGSPRPQAHHITGGTKGRSDEYVNIAMLCGPDMQTGAEGCHAKANTSQLPMGRILKLKWQFDKQHISWVRLCLLAGRFLQIEE